MQQGQAARQGVRAGLRCRKVLSSAAHVASRSPESAHNYNAADARAIESESWPGAGSRGCSRELADLHRHCVGGRTRQTGSEQVVGNDDMRQVQLRLAVAAGDAAGTVSTM